MHGIQNDQLCLQSLHWPSAGPSPRMFSSVLLKCGVSWMWFRPRGNFQYLRSKDSKVLPTRCLLAVSIGMSCWSFLGCHRFKPRSGAATKEKKHQSLQLQKVDSETLPKKCLLKKFKKWCVWVTKSHPSPPFTSRLPWWATAREASFQVQASEEGCDIWQSDLKQVTSVTSWYSS